MSRLSDTLAKPARKIGHAFRSLNEPRMHHPLPKLSLTPATSSPHHGPGQYPHSHTYPPPQAPTGFQPLNRYETHPRNDRLLPPISEQIMSGTLSQGGAFGANRKISRSASVVSLVQAYNEEGQMVNEMIFSPDADPEGPGCCALLLALVSILLIIATLPFSLCMCIKVVQEYERSVIFRLGRLRKGGAKGPGIFFIIPCIDTYRKVDLRTVSFDVPPQEVLSRDSVTVTVDAVVYYRVSNPTMATNNVEDFSHSTHLLAATTLRNVLGTKHLAEILSERETISHVMEQTLDEATDPWGVKVERVEIKDVRLPVQLQRAMAAEAEAAREARAKVIAAEGEQKASRALREASDVISESPSALQLRYLQTLNTISAEKNSTIIFPVPLDIISHFFTGGKKQA